MKTVSDLLQARIVRLEKAIAIFIRAEYMVYDNAEYMDKRLAALNDIAKVLGYDGVDNFYTKTKEDV